jgi:hypothetical protein
MTQSVHFNLGDDLKGAWQGSDPVSEFGSREPGGFRGEPGTILAL